MMNYFRNDAVIFGCAHKVNFHSVVALFLTNSQNGAMIISLDVKHTLSVRTFVSR